jgi:hypothetical protein
VRAAEPVVSYFINKVGAHAAGCQPAGAGRRVSAAAESSGNCLTRARCAKWSRAIWPASAPKV